MLTQAELAEMLEIRRKIDALYVRYNELTSKMAAPVPTAAPQQPVATVAAIATPAPVPATPAIAVSPALPVAAPVPSAPVTPNVSSATEEQETKKRPAVVLPVSEPAAPSLLPADRATWTLKHYVMEVVIKAAKPLPFEEIYSRLEAGGAPLPADKPKLVVRQILFNKANFQPSFGGYAVVGAPAAASPVAAKNNPAIARNPSELLKKRMDSLLGRGGKP